MQKYINICDSDRLLHLFHFSETPSEGNAFAAACNGTEANMTLCRVIPVERDACLETAGAKCSKN